MSRRAALLLAFLLPCPAGAGCPEAAVAEERLASLDWEALARRRRFASAPPPALRAHALAHPGTVAVARDGRKGFAAVAAALPLPDLWRALNDEDHHGGFLVDRSAVVAGTARGPSRILAQALSRYGIGRYWVDRVELSAELFRETSGRVWELTFEDAFGAVAADHPRLRQVAGDLPPVAWTRGAWALVAVEEGCTLVDYFVWSDPGGALSTFQSLGAKGAIRDALEGLLRMAREHAPQPHPGLSFSRPDGSPLP